MIQIEISEDRLQQIKELAEAMSKQDNKATQYPLYYVYQIEEREVTGIDDYDHVYYYSGDYEAVETEEESTGARYVKVYEVPVVNVGPFLTEQGAEDHIRTNSYHYNKPFVYVNSAWRNYEMQGLLQFMFEVAGMPVPSQYK